MASADPPVYENAPFPIYPKRNYSNGVGIPPLFKYALLHQRCLVNFFRLQTNNQLFLLLEKTFQIFVKRMVNSHTTDLKVSCSVHEASEIIPNMKILKTI